MNHRSLTAFAVNGPVFGMITDVVIFDADEIEDEDTMKVVRTDHLVTLIREKQDELDCVFLPDRWTPEMIVAAVQMINVLANTPPSERRSKKQIYDELAQFRTKA